MGTLPLVNDPRLFARAREVIRARIADGTYEPGTRVHIGGLADELGVARPTIARALGDLAVAGLVRYWPGLGWYVEAEK
jgi:DNA-binding GntR family transcriptional regulator